MRTGSLAPVSVTAVNVLSALLLATLGVTVHVWDIPAIRRGLSSAAFRDRTAGWLAVWTFPRVDTGRSLLCAGAVGPLQMRPRSPASLTLASQAGSQTTVWPKPTAT